MLAILGDSTTDFFLHVPTSLLDMRNIPLTALSHLKTIEVYTISFFLLFIYFFYIYFFLRDRDRVQRGEGQRENETQNPKQVPGSKLSAQSPMQDSNPPTNCEVMT